MTVPTEYANTDFDLESKMAFNILAQEFEESCCLLHYSQSKSGLWLATVEANHIEDYSETNAEKDILAILEAISNLSPAAQAELNACSLREFNLGFHCGDTWAYSHKLPTPVIAGIAKANCSIAVTLYPTQHPEITTPEATATEEH